MPADHESRIGLRVGAALRSTIESAGDVSSVARALLIIGLHTMGADVAPFVEDGGATLHRISDPQLKSTLLRVLFNKDGTDFQHFPQEEMTVTSTAPNAANGRSEPENDPLASIGIEV